jgi:Protein of unknown function (DUF4239)
MRPEIVYEYPTWLVATGIVLATAAASMLVQAAIHRFASMSFRARQNDTVAAIFAIIGVTYAVLLAFVAMLTWEGFNKARAATFEEAGALVELHRLSFGLPGPVSDALRADLASYARNVVRVEFPAQARGAVDMSSERWLRDLHALVGAWRPDAPGEAAVAAQFLVELGSLGAARQGRLLASEATVPAVVWAVVLAGGALMIVFSALLGAASYALHLALTGALGASGALVLVLIVTLNNPFRSDFRISPAAFSMQPALMNPG